MLFFENLNIRSLYIRSAGLLTARHYYAAVATIAEFLWLPAAQQALSSAFEGDAVLWCIVDRGAFPLLGCRSWGLCSKPTNDFGALLSIVASAASVGPKPPSLRDQWTDLTNITVCLLGTQILLIPITPWPHGSSNWRTGVCLTIIGLATSFCELEYRPTR